MDICKYCGHGYKGKMGEEDIPQRCFDQFNICSCPCHWGEGWTSPDKMLLIAKEFWEDYGKN